MRNTDLSFPAKMLNWVKWGGGAIYKSAILLGLFSLHLPSQAGLFDGCTDPCAEIGACDETSCDPCDAADCGITASIKGKGKFFVNGFIESGFWANEFGMKSLYYGRNPGFHHNIVGPGNDGILQNVQNTGYQVNQLYVSAGKSVDGRRGWDFGGTADFVFGTDATYVQAIGMEYASGHGPDSWGTGDYYSAFAQAYFEAEYKKWNVKAGKFYAPFGSQGFRGDQNFFYSFAPNYDFLPHTASGAYATYTVNSKLALIGGWVVPDMFGETSRNNAFLGGAVWQASQKLNLTYFFGSGTMDAEYAPKHPMGWLPPYDVDYFVNSLVGTYQFNKKWKAVIDWSLFNIQIDDLNYHNTAYGLNSALFYQYSKTLAFGVRYNYISGSSDEWRAANLGEHYGVNGLYGYGGWGVKYWQAISLGANWSPTKWLTVKPEIRWDFAETGSIPGGGYFVDKSNNWHKQQFSGGLSTVVKF